MKRKHTEPDNGTSDWIALCCLACGLLMVVVFLIGCIWWLDGMAHGAFGIMQFTVMLGSLIAMFPLFHMWENRSTSHADNGTEGKARIVFVTALEATEKRFETRNLFGHPMYFAEDVDDYLDHSLIPTLKAFEDGQMRERYVEWLKAQEGEESK